jgi:ABC-2 type transport system ATP-binding protein
VLSAVALTRRFGAQTAVEDVSFDVGRAEIVALLGPNGAGKTTTMRMLGGLIAPTSGTVVIGGETLTAANGSRLRARVGFLTETPGLWDRLTVRENLRVYAGLYGVAHPDRAIDRVLELFELGHSSASRTVELSKGMRQRVALARTVLHEPAILLLDEPTSGLDPEVARSIRRLLAERRSAGCAILISTHNLDEAERLADRVAVLHRHLLAFEQPQVLRRRLMNGRLVVRMAREAGIFVPTARCFDQSASCDGTSLLLTLGDRDRDTPKLARALVEAGAEILEIRPEIQPLEDVYLHLVNGTGGQKPS